MAPVIRLQRMALHVRPVAARGEYQNPELSVPALELLPGQQFTCAGDDGYTFTHVEGVLSTEQRQFYEQNGYLVVKCNLPQHDLDKYREHFAQLCSREIPAPPGLQVVRDLGSVRTSGKDVPATLGTINKIQNIEQDTVLFSYAQHPNIVRLLPAFTGPTGAKVVPFTSMLVNKPPDVGLGTSRHPLHQDLWFFPFRPANKVVAAWTALQRITRENGALFAVPGTHRSALCPHVKPDEGLVNAGFVGIQGKCSETVADSENVVWIEMDPGDTVFFHPLLHHGSGRNTSNTTRQAISIHYVSTDCTYFDPRLDPVQADRWKRISVTGGHQYGDGNTTDMVHMYKKRLQGTGSPNSQLVYGKEGDHENAV